MTCMCRCKARGAGRKCDACGHLRWADVPAASVHAQQPWGCRQPGSHAPRLTAWCTLCSRCLRPHLSLHPGPARQPHPTLFRAPQIFFQIKYFLPDPIANDVKYQASAQPFLVFGLLTTGLAIGHVNQVAGL